MQKNENLFKESLIALAATFLVLVALILSNIIPSIWQNNYFFETLTNKIIFPDYLIFLVRIYSALIYTFPFWAVVYGLFFQTLVANNKQLNRTITNTTIYLIFFLSLIISAIHLFIFSYLFQF